ncbi:hypothetical protein C206_09004 [Pseudomonas putida TRO1]|uniref:Large ATP-binding protein n=2 Tax=Pseudomonas TaxID=286 RepID=A0AAD2WCA2_PSEPU|nr:MULTISPECIES: hypothetical protein [Pseudomonas]HCI3894483.1 hypothetical protein [Pseudomonas aeruginosa]ELS0924725.1 hypothetical protein [Pseudomonas putida]ENY78110.1 hypothetical protein C206_09004 [Pseudomonas putida TRO1]PKF25187.1 hypothetical protein CW309_17810 [Pseudomonas hunanensis]UWH24622.1 hypothetical protein KW568_09470 [Pseudomonas sp. HD6515]
MTMSWLETVANDAGLSVTDAESRLQQRGVYVDRPVRPTPKLSVTAIAFKGQKVGKVEGAIDFSWTDLSPGVWAVTSHGSLGKSNLVGKSSVLEIILWCLRGEVKGLQEDVRSWLSWVKLSFNLDDRPHIIEFDVKDKRPNGVLKVTRPNGVTDTIDRFSSDDGFAAAMSRFMMSAFDLQSIPSRKDSNEGGSTVSHGWPALSGALYFGGDHKALLGDVLMAGLPARMLQLYIGLPWASTVMQAGTAKKEIEQQLAYANRTHLAQNHQSTESRVRISAQLEQARRDLASLSSTAITAEVLDKLTKDAREITTQTLQLEQAEAQATAELAILRSESDNDQRALRDLREHLVTTAFFTGLQPSCCPRCEKAVPQTRIKRESVEQSCSLCSEPISLDEQDDSSERLSAAETRAAASQAAYQAAKAIHKDIQSKVKSASNQLSLAQQALTNASNSLSYQQQRTAEILVARLEGELQAHNTPLKAPKLPEDAGLIDIALKTARKAFDGGKVDLMFKLNQEILRLANEFGALGLESIELGSDAKMTVGKGNQKSPFSKLTPGERLRLRIATAIALLRVGQSLGVGRHPGLLIIDSPGSEETSEGDLAKLLTELRRVANETQGLQIFIASANAPAVINALGESQCRVAPEGGYVW